MGRPVRSALVAVAALPFAAPAFAESEADWAVSGQLSLASDYRFRGLSFSGKDPQASASLTMAHRSGVYGSIWTSNADLGDGADDLEADFTVGWAGQASGLTLDLGATYYSYPARSDLNLLELYASASRKVGAVTVKVGGAYAPPQDSTGSQDNAYAFVAGELPLEGSPVTLRAAAGIEDGAFANGKIDWKLGLSYNLGAGLAASLDYIDTARASSPSGGATALAGIAWNF